tara:strand:- start:1432 stop:2469 length:1038 start_codon:yes stop_codon:yes gene_type:complete
MEQKFIQTLRGEKSDHIPVWLMRQAGRYLPEYREIRQQAGDFLSLCYNPALASEVTLQPLRRFDLDAAIIFSDILVVPHALGQKVWFVEGEGPRLDPVHNLFDLPLWNEETFLNHLSPVFEALDKTREALPDDKSLIGFAGAPWTLACYMINGRGSRDYQNVRGFAMLNPSAFNDLIDLLVTAISAYLIKKIEAGANALQIFDSWSGVLSAEEFKRYSIDPVTKIVKAVKAVHPDIPIIGFPRGAGLNYEDFVKLTGIDCVSCDQGVPLTSMKKMQGKICVQGNLDNLLLLEGGEAMTHQAEVICKALQDGPFIFNLGHGVIKETNPDSVTLLIETIRKIQRQAN